MSAPSHTTINVAKRSNQRTFDNKGYIYRHFFHVDVDTHPTMTSCKEVIASLKRNYPAPKFEIGVTYWECRGTDVPLDTILATKRRVA